MRIKSSTSFSLLEIIVAMLILSLVVAGLFGLFVTSFKFIVEAGNRQQALNYARTVAEHLKVYVSADPSNPTNAGQILSGNIADNPHEPDNPVELGIPLSTGVTDCVYTVVDDISGTDMKQVTITVTYPEL